MKDGQILAILLLAGVGVGGGYVAYTQYQKKHPKPTGTVTESGQGQQQPAPVQSTAPVLVNPLTPAPYVPTEQIGIKPIEASAPALAPTLAPSPDAVLAKMQADWEAQQKAMQAQLEAQYQADLQRQSNAREAEMLRLQRESQAREAELMARQQEELRRQNELIQQAEQSRQRELETLRRQEEARKAAEQARIQDRVITLNSQLRDVQDQIRLTENRLNALNSSQPDAAFIETVRAMLEARCRATHFFDLGCSSPKELDATVPGEWQKKLAADRVPLVDQLTTLRAREKAILADIASLNGTAGGYGYDFGPQTQPVQPRDTALYSTPNTLSTYGMLSA